MPNFDENRGTNTILGNREHKKTHFQFWGNKPIYFRGTREQVSPWEGLGTSCMQNQLSVTI